MWEDGLGLWLKVRRVKACGLRMEDPLLPLFPVLLLLLLSPRRWFLSGVVLALPNKGGWSLFCSWWFWLEDDGSCSPLGVVDAVSEDKRGRAGIL